MFDFSNWQWFNFGVSGKELPNPHVIKEIEKLVLASEEQAKMLGDGIVLNKGVQVQVESILVQDSLNDAAREMRKLAGDIDKHFPKPEQ